MVEEPSAAEAVAWLHGLRGKYERYHGVRFTDGAITTGRPCTTEAVGCLAACCCACPCAGRCRQPPAPPVTACRRRRALRAAAAAVEAAQRYIIDRRLPDSAIDVIDEAAARARLAASTLLSPSAAAAALAQQQPAGVAGAAQAAAGSQGQCDAERLQDWLAAQPSAPPSAAAAASAPAGGLAAAMSGAAAAAAQRYGPGSAGLGANAGNALSCPHCGTPVQPPENSGTHDLGAVDAPCCVLAEALAPAVLNSPAINPLPAPLSPVQ